MRFYTTAYNSRAKKIGVGGRSTGQEVHTRGWDAGVRIEAKPDGKQDVFDVFATGGSNSSNNAFKIGTVMKVDGVVTFIPATNDPKSN